MSEEQTDVVEIDSWKNVSTYLPQTTMKQNYIASNRFILLHKLGKGGFGLIYAGIDILTGKEIAIKLEDISRARKKYLRLEYKIYKRLQSDWYYFPYDGPKNTPTIYFYGQDGGFRVLVMDLLGPSLSELFVYQHQQFSIKTCCMLAVKMINAIEHLHSKGLLHRDVKPGNFVTGRGENANEIYAIDYGLASPYIDGNGNHIPYSNEARFHGTDKYASINNHRKIEPGRRDDLESVGYLLIYFAKGNLPWAAKHRNVKKRNRRKVYGDTKEKTSIEELTSGLPSAFEEYFMYIKRLHFSDRPDYDYLRYIFYRTLVENGEEFDNVMDWAYTPEEDSSEE
eukprot:TRINITY_DN11600_c0_g1_i1.p1 TRINITY_DN11600_c0_g1~~TRINITY_DN11600_c0_g1_i1.p1  ORF type:complete len:351 (-),score=62.43 TRINITY_DN11600_c0_g1_i1:97-1113(-)